MKTRTFWFTVLSLFCLLIILAFLAVMDDGGRFWIDGAFVTVLGGLAHIVIHYSDCIICR